MTITYLITSILYIWSYNLYQQPKGIYAGLSSAPLRSFLWFIGACIVAVIYIVAMCLFVGADKENKWTYNIMAISSLLIFVLYCGAYLFLIQPDAYYEIRNINPNLSRYLFIAAIILSIVQVVFVIVQWIRKHIIQKAIILSQQK